jgi:tetratricopeptide (TPR) repeat protein
MTTAATQIPGRPRGAAASRWLWLVPVLAALVVYSQSPRSGLFWDDHMVVNMQIGHFNGLRDLWFPPRGIPNLELAYYRPVVWATQLFDDRVFGRGATVGPHAMNVLYHLVTTFFVWLLARYVLRHRAAGAAGALVVGALFAVHPIHTESVIWLSGRSDVLATMFLVPAVLAALIWRDRGSVVALSLAAVLLTLALWSKEVAVVGLALVPAALVLLHRHGSAAGAQAPLARRMWTAIVVVLAAALGQYLALRSLAGASAAHWPFRPFDAAAVWDMLRAAAYYPPKLILPWPQSVFVAGNMMPGLFLTVIVLALSAVALVAAGRTAWRGRDGLALFGLFWFAAAVAPALGIAMSSHAESIVAERYLYLPSVGAALVAGALYCHEACDAWRRTLGWVAIAVLLAFAAATVQRSVVWRTDLDLWRDATVKTTTHGFPWNMLGVAWRERGDRERALQAFLRGRELQNRPVGLANLNVNIGDLHRERAEPARAVPYLIEAIAADPDNTLGNFTLGRVHFDIALAASAAAREESFRQAAYWQRQALQRDPQFVLARVELGRALVGLGDAYWHDARIQDAAETLRAAMMELDLAMGQAGADTERRQIVAIQDKARSLLRQMQRAATR